VKSVSFDPSSDPSSPQGRAQGLNDTIFYPIGMEKTVKCYEERMEGM